MRSSFAGCAAVIILVAGLFAVLARVDQTYIWGASIAVSLVCVGVMVVRRRRAARRRADLVRRFGEEAAEAILAGRIWMGQTEQELLETLGPPEDIGERRTKARRVQTLKYRRIGAGRYGLKVTIEDGVVTGWDER